MSALEGRIQRVQAEIARACDAAGRHPAEVTLIAVSKTHPASTVLEALAAGLHHFGENRVEEAAGKIAEVSAARPGPAPVWHMIGHVQSRKAGDVAPLFDAIHSVDSLRLAIKLARAVPEGRRLRVLLECNVSGEAAKAGFSAHGWAHDPAQFEDISDALEAMILMQALDICGLMTMAPMVEDMEQARPVFRSLRRLRDALQDDTGHALPELSMGMSDDYPVAIAEGATFVRVGRALFGERPVTLTTER